MKEPVKTANIVWPLIILIAAGILLALVGVFGHQNEGDQYFANSNVYVLEMTGAFVVLGAFGFVRRSTISNKRAIFNLAIITAFCIVAVLGVNVAANMWRAFQKMAVEPWETYGYYFNIAQAEELFYRVFLITATINLISSRHKFTGFCMAIVMIYVVIWAGYVSDVVVRGGYYLLVATVVSIIISRMRNYDPPSTITKGFAVVVSGTIFSLAHVLAYPDAPEMLVATFISGMIEGACFVYGRSMIPAIAAHVVNNLVAARAILAAMATVI